MPNYTLVYYEMTRVARDVEAPSVEEAIAMGEAMREEHNWEDCEEEALGTNGVEEVIDENGNAVYSSGTIWGKVEEQK